jgi:hypothetical protein
MNDCHTCQCMPPLVYKAGPYHPTNFLWITPFSRWCSASYNIAVSCPIILLFLHSNILAELPPVPKSHTFCHWDSQCRPKLRPKLRLQVLLHSTSMHNVSLHPNMYAQRAAESEAKVRIDAAFSLSLLHFIISFVEQLQKALSKGVSQHPSQAPSYMMPVRAVSLPFVHLSSCSYALQSPPHSQCSSPLMMRSVHILPFTSLDSRWPLSQKTKSWNPHRLFLSHFTGTL